MMTGDKQNVQIDFKKAIFIFEHIGVIEVILVDVTTTCNSILQFEYHNIYHQFKLVTPPNITYSGRKSGEMEYSVAWYHVQCAPADCFHKLVQMGKNVSRLGKYFWTIEGISVATLVKLTELANLTDNPGHRYSHDVLKKVADVTTFHQIISYLILEDVLIYGFALKHPYHHFEGLFPLYSFQSRGYGFILHGVKKYGFVSCYGIKKDSDTLGTLSSPFDVTSWAYMAVCFIIVVLILTSILRRFISDALVIFVGISLENSGSLSAYEIGFKRKGYVWNLYHSRNLDYLRRNYFN